MPSNFLVSSSTLTSSSALSDLTSLISDANNTPGQIKNQLATVLGDSKRAELPSATIAALVASEVLTQQISQTSYATTHSLSALPASFTTLAASGATTLIGALDANSTADIADTLTLSKTTGTGLTVTADATIGGNLSVTGNLTVNGTTTTVNSTTVQIKDPVIDLGGGDSGVTLTTDDGKDRGLIFNYYDGTAAEAKIAFFGYDNSNGNLTFIPDATNINDVFTGTKGSINADLVFDSVIDRDNASQITSAVTANTTLLEYLNDIYYKLHWLNEHLSSNITINPTPPTLTWS